MEEIVVKKLNYSSWATGKTAYKSMEGGINMTKRPSYRCENKKYKRLKKKLIEDEMSYQDFADLCVDHYLANKINPKGE